MGNQTLQFSIPRYEKTNKVGGTHFLSEVMELKTFLA